MERGDLYPDVAFVKSTFRIYKDIWGEVIYKPLERSFTKAKKVPKRPVRHWRMAHI